MINNKRRIIKNADQLAQFVENESQQNCLLIVMFSTISCPPCNNTKRMLNMPGQDGFTNMEFVSTEFARRHDIPLSLYTCTLDNLDEEMRNFSPSREFLNSFIFNEILRVRLNVRVLPTFHAFYVNKGNAIDLYQVHFGGINSPDKLLSIAEAVFFLNATRIHSQNKVES